MTSSLAARRAKRARQPGVHQVLVDSGVPGNWSAVLPGGERVVFWTWSDAHEYYLAHREAPDDRDSDSDREQAHG